MLNSLLWEKITLIIVNLILFTSVNAMACIGAAIYLFCKKVTVSRDGAWKQIKDFKWSE